MTTVHARDRSAAIAIGYHLFVETTPHGPRYSHDGALSGYWAFMAHYPGADVTFAMWTNSTGDDQEEAWETFTDAVVQAVVR